MKKFDSRDNFNKKYQRDIINIDVKKLTNIDDLHLANWTTSGKTSRQSLGNAYKTLHSTTRTQQFRVVCENIPNFVAMHLVRHTQGVDPYIQSRRPDVSGIDTSDVTRYTPTNYTFFCNAQSLINMSMERLCRKHPSPETRDVFEMIKANIKEIDPAMALNMVPKCVFRNGMCPENTSCGLYKMASEEYVEYYSQFKFRSKPCSCATKSIKINEHIKSALDAHKVVIDCHTNIGEIYK